MFVLLWLIRSSQHRQGVLRAGMEHGGTNVEVRPGNAVFKQLFDVVTSTAERLDGIWEHVGCSAEERKEHLDGRSPQSTAV